MGRKKTKKTKECLVCGNEFEFYPKREKNTCSRKCMGIFQTGKNNPNYGNVWTDEQRQNKRDYLSSTKEVRSKAITKSWVDQDSRRGEASKKMSECRRNGTIPDMVPGAYSHSDEVLGVISEKSKAKWTSEYKAKHRQKMEELGRIRPLDDVSDYEIYYKESNWQEKMFDKVKDGFELLKEHGIFHAGQNNNGVVRDHIMGRKHGFENNIYPEILRHPCNCQVLRQRENISKGQKGKNRPDCDITLTELFDNIKKYEDEWFEQEIVLELINKYENGSRWSRNGGFSDE